MLNPFFFSVLLLMSHLAFEIVCKSPSFFSRSVWWQVVHLVRVEQTGPHWTGFILKIKEQIPKFSQTFFKDFYQLLPGKYLKRLKVVFRLGNLK